MSTPLEFATREEWLAWRRTGIGASDCPIILGLSKYSTPFKLFEEKTGRVKPTEIRNPAIDKGNELEPIAREKYAARYNYLNFAQETFAAKNVTSATLPYMRASLDGCSKDQTLIIEIKYQGQAAHADAKLGKVSEMYYAQVQHQLFCSGALRAVLVSINIDQEIVTVSIARSDEYISKLVKECMAFWAYVKANNWPTESPWAMTHAATEKVEPPSIDGTGKTLAEYFMAWQEISTEIKALEGQKKEIQDLIFATEVEVCGQFRVQTVERKGNVDYAKIEILKSINLDQYRNPPTLYKQIKVVKE